MHNFKWNIFPGHYTGRATHIHDGTITWIHNSRSSHVEQIFFDQDLISAIKKNAPYNTNTQELTKNSVDSILETEADTTDPFVEYVYLGKDASNGIFAWISIRVNAA
ncbi:hypothetical protein BDV24DRAFT_159268 [Aspergillus arachidicola]|uniref:Uncharacterized protein n=1 Tax=Aspergillus arachidicola TaxID=656916 RepID=A0A5N6YMU4_9EURO|nr:hypothetical protein BDV24DRAFT_159268 [Aspergillus arachidicola]